MNIYNISSLLFLSVAALGSISVPASMKIKNTILVQAYSQYCATNFGICTVNPQPVGSPCACGQYQGTIIFQ